MRDAWSFRQRQGTSNRWRCEDTLPFSVESWSPEGDNSIIITLATSCQLTWEIHHSLQHNSSHSLVEEKHRPEVGEGVLPQSLGVSASAQHSHSEHKLQLYIHNQRKLGSNLPSYGQIELWDLTFLIIHSWRVVWDFKSHNNTSWRVVWDCETLRYTTTHSWRVVWGFTSHNNTSWRMVWDCETLHYITIHSWGAEWDLTSHITSQNKAFVKGGVRLYIPLCITWLQNECWMGLVLGRKPEHETMRFSV